MEGGFYSTLFLVPNKYGSQRQVINLKALNKFIVAPHFKIEGIHTLKNLLKPGDRLAKVDLKDTCFSIPIHPDHRKNTYAFHSGKESINLPVSPSALHQHKDPQAD